MLLHGINDNIIITRPYYPGVYQDEWWGMIDLTRDECFSESEPNQKNDKISVHVSPSTLGV